MAKETNVSKQIGDAGEAFQKAITDMGCKNAVVLFSFTEDDADGIPYVKYGYKAESYLQAIGLCELVKKNLLFNPD